MLTIALTTMRQEPRFDLFVESLFRSAAKHPAIDWELVVIDGLLWYDLVPRAEKLDAVVRGRIPYIHIPPKPSVWQGPHRLTQRDHWDACGARNTAFCYARGQQVVFIDDCMEVCEDWLAQHAHGECKEAIYIGTWRFANMTVQETDHRSVEHPLFGECPAHWTYGMNVSVPLNAALEVNGYDEAYSGQAGVEDCDLGIRIGRRMVEAYFDPACVVTQFKETHNDVCRYTPKNKKLRSGQVRYANEWLTEHILAYDTKRTWTLDRRYVLADLRRAVLSGKPFPVPTMPDRDWRDGQYLKDM